jgi:hypothetical protein
MMKAIKKAMAFLAVLSALAAGCVQPVSEKPAAPGAGVLRVTLEGGASRTLMPSNYDPYSLYYTLTFSSPDRETVTGHIDIGETSGEFTLITGTWDLAVRGFASAEDAADPAKALASGEEKGIEVHFSRGTEASVTLMPGESISLTQDSTGTLSYHISFPDGALLAGLTVYDEDGTALKRVDLIGAHRGSIALDSGVYNLGITLYMDGKSAVMGTSAHIYDGLVTAAVLSFGEDDFAAYSPEALITDFTLKAGDASYKGRIDQAARTITVPAPGLSDVDGLTAELAHTGFSIDPDPAEERDYTGPVAYTVGMEDGAMTEYTVRVNRDPVITGISGLTEFLSSPSLESRGKTPDDPIPVILNGDLMWWEIVDAIGKAEKYLDLDISECKLGYGYWFYPSEKGHINTGETYLVGLVLPNEITRIDNPIRYEDGKQYHGNAFKYFNHLKTLSALNVRSVEQSMFSGNTSLVSVSLPEATFIERSAFAGCTSLASVFLPKATGGGAQDNVIGSSAFSGCTSLTSVFLPEATDIGENAFAGCTSLASVSLPKAASIGRSAFAGCTSLVSVSLPEVTGIGNDAFAGCTSPVSVSLPKATGIGDDAFADFTGLVSLSLPKAVSIGHGAFSGCTSLVSVFLPEATSIGERTDFAESAFSGCTGLVSVSLPKAAGIGEDLFSGCTSLAFVNLPEVTSIGKGAFSGCTSLTSLSLPKTADIDDSAFKDCTSLAFVDLPVAANIGDSAFSGCTILASVDLPVATDIGQAAFFGCVSLISVDLPTAVTIGRISASPIDEAHSDGTFEGCTSLASVDLPAATSIGDSAFSDCTSLASVDLPVATDIGSWTFSGCTSLASVDLSKATSIGSGVVTGAEAFTVTLGATAPELGDGYPNSGSVTVLVPPGATGYGKVPGTYSGDDTISNWGNYFRGLRNGMNPITGPYNYVNGDITLTIDYLPE